MKLIQGSKCTYLDTKLNVLTLNETANSNKFIAAGAISH